MRRYLSIASVVLASALFAACGGGGGGGADAPAQPSTSFNFLSAYRAYTLAGATVNFSVSGTCSGTATSTDAAAVPATFEGVSGYSVAETFTLNFTNCVPASSAATGTSYYDTNLTPLGSSIPGEEYSKFQTPPPPLPATVKVGDTAQYGTLTIYADSTKAVVTGSRVLSYVVEADTASSAIINLISREYDTSNRLLYTQQSRYRINSAGTLAPVSIDIQYSTTSTTHIVLTKV